MKVMAWIFLILISLTFIGCKKETNITQSEKNVSNDFKNDIYQNYENLVFEKTKEKIFILTKDKLKDRTYENIFLETNNEKNTEEKEGFFIYSVYSFEVEKSKYIALSLVDSNRVFSYLFVYNLQTSRVELFEKFYIDQFFIRSKVEKGRFFLSAIMAPYSEDIVRYERKDGKFVCIDKDSSYIYK